MQPSKNLNQGRAEQRDPPGWLPEPLASRLQVMVVEDSELDRMICERAVKKAGRQLDCELHESALDALARLRDSQTPLPELILLDVNLPEMNGLEFLEEVAVNPFLSAKLSVLIMTSSPLPPVLRRRLAAFRSCIGEVEKPITAAKVRAALTDRQRLRRARTVSG